MAAGGAGLSRKGRQDEPTSLWISHFVVALTQVGFAGGFVLSKFTLTSGVNPLVISVYRDVIALLVLAPAAYFVERGQRTALDLTTLALCVLLGAIGLFVSQLLVLIGLALATAALSSVVSITIPVGVFIISAIFGLEEINWRGRDGYAKVAGCISAVIGAVLTPLYRGPVVLGTALPSVHGDPLSELHLANYGTFAPLLSYLDKETWQIGVILLLLAGMSVATYICLQVVTLRRYPAPISLTTYEYVFGALMLATTAVLTIQDRSDWVTVQPAAVMSIVYLGLIPSAFNFAVSTWVIRRTGPVLLASYAPLQSIVTACLAHLLLGESIHLGSVLGTLFIISGLCLITWGKLNGQKPTGHPVVALPAPDGLAIIKGPSELNEPLLG